MPAFVFEFDAFELVLVEFELRFVMFMFEPFMLLALLLPAFVLLVLALLALVFALVWIVTLALLMVTFALLALVLAAFVLLAFSPPPQADRPATPANARSAKVLRIDRSPELL